MSFKSDGEEELLQPKELHLRTFCDLKMAE